MHHVVACTVVAKSHLSHARVLARSLKRHHPEIPFVTLLADEIDGYFEPVFEPFGLFELAELEIPRIQRLKFQYSQQPLSYAATPYLLARLLALGFDGAVFLKQESLVLGNLSSLVEALGRSAIVLTPHLLRPLCGPDRIQRELNILQSGAFNAGVVGVARTDTGDRFLRWWQNRVSTHCRHAVPEGMHYEQRWLDLVPAFFEDVAVLRDPTYNVGHWNLPDRSIDMTRDGVLVEGRPCRVFRFSGYSPDDPRTVTKYLRRLTWANVGPARDVFDRFRTELEDAGYHETKTWPYSYRAFDNGVPIPDIARSLYLELGDDVDRFGDPFQTTRPNSYFRWLNEPAGDSDAGAGNVTRLWQAVHRSRLDLQRAFPDPLGADGTAFLTWAAGAGCDHHGVPAAFLAASQR
jgi:hypothetical protein